jgi:plastocyanin
MMVTSRQSCGFVAFAAFAALFAAHARGQGIEIAASVSDDKGRPVADAIVIAAPADGAVRSATRVREAIVDQVNKEFEPRVTAVFVGTAVTFPNHDDVRHQVYSFSPAKRFELPLYAGVPSQPVVFDRPGVVVLGCNIHDWMVGYVYVSDSPYFAKTGKDGKALLTDLPPNTYVMRVWHPQLDGSEEATRKPVDLTRSRSVEVAWTIKLKPEAKVRRAPLADRPGRY